MNTNNYGYQIIEEVLPDDGMHLDNSRNSIMLVRR